MSLPTGCPAGIHMRIACRGVFSAVEEPSGQVEASGAHAQTNVELDSSRHANYRWFYDAVDGDSWEQVLD